MADEEEELGTSGHEVEQCARGNHKVASKGPSAPNQAFLQIVAESPN